MPVKRISDINIMKRGLFTALYGVEANEFFVDEDLRKYTLWQQLYIYLKQESFDMVLFYDTTNNFHSYSQRDLVKFLDPGYFARPETANARRGRYVASHIKSPLRHQRLQQAETLQEPAGKGEQPLLPSIQSNSLQGEMHAFWRTSVNQSLLEYCKATLSNNKERVAIIIKYPDNSFFEHVDDFITFFHAVNNVYQINDSGNKVIIAYRDSTTTAFIENLNKGNRHLFVDPYFQSHFLIKDAKGEHINQANVFSIAYPDAKEIRSWLNRKRLFEGARLFDSIGPNKIVTRLVQERKLLSALQAYSLNEFITSINSQSGWDQLHELIGLNTLKAKISDLVNDLKDRRDNRRNMVYRPHLCFTGNPGTGKTTVAGIVARIFKEEDIIPLGHYVYAKATELMGNIVGDAALLVKQKCQEAEGGVLFIDEAYAFNEEGTAVYGHSAVTELITWMENKDWQNKTVLILGGYPDEMHELLNSSNAGLKGRIREDHFLLFENFTPQELRKIFRLQVDRSKMTITDEAEELLEKIFGRLVKMYGSQRDWDNARRVENIFQQVYSRTRIGKVNEITEQHIPEDLVSLVKGRQVNDIRETNEYIKLNKLIGLQEVKRKINDLIETVEYDLKRIENGEIDEINLPNFHLAFVGPPGTGKTTVAKLFGGLLKNLGLLPRGHVHAVTGKDLIAGYKGQSAGKTNAAIQKAMGGVLFIDEAYTLAGEMGGDFEDAVITALLDVMESKRDQMVVIAAGYEQRMNHFFATNVGLASRFQTIHFNNFSNQDLIAVFDLYCREAKVELQKDAGALLTSYFSLKRERDKTSFANSRTARNLFQEADNQRKKRLNKKSKTGSLEEEEKKMQDSDIRSAIQVLDADIFLRIGLSSSSKISIGKRTNKNGTGLRELIYDYCILDGHIWTEATSAIFHKTIVKLKKIYSRENRKLVMPVSTYKTLTETAAQTSNSDNKVDAAIILKMINFFLEGDKTLVIAGMEQSADTEPAWENLFDFAAKVMQEGKSVLFVSNTGSAGMQMKSMLEDMKIQEPGLPAFEVSNMQAIEEPVDELYKAYAE